MKTYEVLQTHGGFAAEARHSLLAQASWLRSYLGSVAAPMAQVAIWAGTAGAAATLALHVLARSGTSMWVVGASDGLLRDSLVCLLRTTLVATRISSGADVVDLVGHRAMPPETQVTLWTVSTLAATSLPLHILASCPTRLWVANGACRRRRCRHWWN